MRRIQRPVSNKSSEQEDHESDGDDAESPDESDDGGRLTSTVDAGGAVTEDGDGCPGAGGDGRER